MQKKYWVLIGILCFVLILLIAMFLFIGVSGEPFMAGGAVCVSFDKWDMMRADKIILQYRGETHVVTDLEFVRAFCRETLAGTYSEYCCSNLDDGWVEIYRGDRLLRRMRYIENHGSFAYDTDSAHWVLFGKEGHVFLSDPLQQKLREIIGMPSQ